MRGSPLYIFYEHKMKLYDFQVNTANFIIDRIQNMQPVLDCSVVGAGKTFIALHVLRQLQRKFIVVCPKIVIAHWKENIQDAELQHICLDVVNYEKIKIGNTPYFTNDCKRTVSKHRVKWNLPDKAIVIFDEAHKLKGFDTINSQLLLNIPTSTATPYLISATIADSPLAFLNVARAFRLCTNQYKFLASFGYSKPHPQRGWKFDNDKQHLIRLHNIIFHENTHPGVRITYDQINILTRINVVKLIQIDDTFNRVEHLYKLIDDTIEQHSNTYKLDIAKPINDELFHSLMLKAQDALNSFDNNQLAEIEQTILLEYADDVLVKRTRLKQFIELIKTKLILPRIMDNYQQGKSIVVMLNYSWSIDMLYKSIAKLTGPSAIGVITGSSKNRNETIKAFQNDEIRLIILNIKAAGVGISLHDTSGTHERVSYISPSDNIYELQQALGRIYRATSKSDAYQYFITVKDSIETTVYLNYINKLNMMSRILTGE